MKYKGEKYFIMNKTRLVKTVLLFVTLMIVFLILAGCGDSSASTTPLTTEIATTEAITESKITEETTTEEPITEEPTTEEPTTEVSDTPYWVKSEKKDAFGEKTGDFTVVGSFPGTYIDENEQEIDALLEITFVEMTKDGPDVTYKVFIDGIPVERKSLFIDLKKDQGDVVTTYISFVKGGVTVKLDYYILTWTPEEGGIDLSSLIMSEEHLQWAIKLNVVNDKGTEVIRFETSNEGLDELIKELKAKKK